MYFDGLTLYLTEIEYSTEMPKVSISYIYHFSNA